MEVFILFTYFLYYYLKYSSVLFSSLGKATRIIYESSYEKKEQSSM